MANFDCGMKQEDFFNLYHPQRGGTVGLDGSTFFRANLGRQRGSGIGGIFGAIARRLIPFATKYILPHAKTLLGNFASDVFDKNRNWKESLKENGINALKGVGRDVLTQSGSGFRRNYPGDHLLKQVRKTIKKSPKPKKIKSIDIFKEWHK
jgi:hypothetical protein